MFLDKILLHGHNTAEVIVPPGCQIKFKVADFAHNGFCGDRLGHHKACHVLVFFHNSRHFDGRDNFKPDIDGFFSGAPGFETQLF